MNTLKLFRYTALAEGLSFLILLGVAVPLKYIWHQPDAVRIFGMAHGVLFVLFVMLAFRMVSSYNKNFKWFAMAFLLSLIPFGTFYLDWKLRKDMA